MIRSTALLALMATFLLGLTPGYAAKEAEEQKEKPVETIPVLEGLNQQAVEKIIVRCAVAREWKISETKPGYVQTKLVHRGYDATLNFKFDDESIEIFNDSYRINRDGERTRKTVPKRWIRYLKKDISDRMVTSHYE